MNIFIPLLTFCCILAKGYSIGFGFLRSAQPRGLLVNLDILGAKTNDGSADNILQGTTDNTVDGAVSWLNSILHNSKSRHVFRPDAYANVYTIAEAIKDAVEMAVVNKYMQYLQKQGDTYALPGGRTSDKDYEVQESRIEGSLIKYLQPDDYVTGAFDNIDNLDESNCARRCVSGAAPKICYYRFVFEPYVTLGAACGNCLNVTSDCFANDCITGDGFEKAILAINRMLPGPAIHVCQGDTIVVDVKNKMGGRSTTIHWHGLRQVSTPWMDGVPMVTQCPIEECQIFRYTFLADVPGLDFYHSHDGLQKVDGIVGGLVIRRPQQQDPNGRLYDFDLPSHLIVIQDWYHKTADSLFPGLRFNDTQQMAMSYLINGRGIYDNTINGGVLSNVPLAEFNVTRNYRYVFRIVAGTCFECQYEFWIQNHRFTIIGTDANDARPQNVDILTMSPGERYTVVVNCNQPIAAYWIHVRTVGLCAPMKAHQVAILRYAGAAGQPRTQRPRYTHQESSNGNLLRVSPVNTKCQSDRQDGVCVTDLRSATNAMSRVTAAQPDTQIVWAFGFHFFTNAELFNSTMYHTFLQSPGPVVASTINGVVNMLPPSPILTQFNDVQSQLFCDPNGYPFSTWNQHRECVHFMPVPMNSVVEIIICDRSSYDPDGISHAIHLHGYDFYLLEEGVFPDGQPFNISLALLQNKLRSRATAYHSNPVKKDTVALSSGGYIIARIYTDNPGYWFFHCHFAYHLDSGMSGILKVGEHSDFRTPPSNFPTCGDYLPPVVQPS